MRGKGITVGLSLLIGAIAYGCGSPTRHFIDDGTGGSAGQNATGGESGAGKGGGSVGTGGGTSGEAGVPGAGASGGASGGSTGTGGSPGEAGQAGAGGEAGVVEPPVPGRPGFDTVAGGAHMKSTNYRLFVATGEAPGGNRVLRSPSYRLVGGLIGSTQP
jgi:hypothetical protein